MKPWNVINVLILFRTVKYVKHVRLRKVSVRACANPESNTMKPVKSVDDHLSSIPVHIIWMQNNPAINKSFYDENSGATDVPSRASISWLGKVAITSLCLFNRRRAWWLRADVDTGRSARIGLPFLSINPFREVRVYVCTNWIFLCRIEKRYNNNRCIAKSRRYKSKSFSFSYKNPFCAQFINRK